jgi:hypothetical protein
MKMPAAARVEAFAMDCFVDAKQMMQTLNV